MNEAINSLHRAEKTFLYGHDKTWHQTTDVNVELDKRGRVVSVWFRCMHLPFTQTVVNDQRAKEMQDMYAKSPAKPLLAVEVADEE